MSEFTVKIEYNVRHAKCRTNTCRRDNRTCFLIQLFRFRFDGLINLIVLILDGFISDLVSATVTFLTTISRILSSDCV